MFALKLLFLLSGILYIISVIAHKLYFSKLKDNVKISNYVAVFAFFLALYILSGFALGIFFKKTIFKLVILFFSLCPFLVGRFATYEREKIFTSIQFILIIVSGIFICVI